MEDIKHKAIINLSGKYLNCVARNFNRIIVEKNKKYLYPINILYAKSEAIEHELYDIYIIYVSKEPYTVIGEIKISDTNICYCIDEPYEEIFSKSL